MKKGEIKETTTMEENIHGIKACHGMALHLRMKGRKLATEIIGLLRNWDNSQDLPFFQAAQVLPVACCISAGWEQHSLHILV